MRSYRSGTSVRPLRGETIGQCMDGTVSRVADCPALISSHQGVRITWGELAGQVNTVARGLLGLGIEKGDRVGLWAPNRAEWLLLQLAAAKVGAVLVNVNPAFRAAELAYTLGQSGTRLLVMAPRFKTSDYLSTVASVRGKLAELQRIVVFDDERAAGAEDLLWSGRRQAR